MDALMLQTRLFQQIERLIGENTKLLDIVAQTLNVSPNTAYKRIKGITPLNLDDIIKLSQEFNISLDNLILNVEDNVVFQFPALKGQPKSYAEYLLPIFQLSELIEQFPNAPFTLYYATNEIPIFHYFSFKELNFFKYYMWAWSAWEFENTNIKKLSFDKPVQADDHFLIMTEKVRHRYTLIPSTEFISETALHNTTQQIKYFLSINRYESPEYALRICQSLREMFEHLAKMAEVGKKFLPGEEPKPDAPDFILFHNEITQSNNMMVAETPIGDHTFATFDNPNLLHTQNDRITQYAKDWFQKQKKRSLPLNQETEKNRLKFFKVMFDHIEKTEREVDLMIKMM